MRQYNQHTQSNHPELYASAFRISHAILTRWTNTNATTMLHIVGGDPAYSGKWL